MILIVCLDDNGGMQFNHRRQSRDGKILEDITAICRGSRLYMDEYSYPLFGNKNIENIAAAPAFLMQAECGTYCFVENIHVLTFEEKIEKIIVYRWNRKYPADFYFDIDLDKKWKLFEIEEFAGKSHDKITKEIYIQ